MLCATSAPAVDTAKACPLSDTIVLTTDAGTVTFEPIAPSDALVLGELDLWTKAKWTVRPFVPALARGEVGIHLYPRDNADFLTKYKDIDSIGTVRFFIACETEEGYKVVPASVLRFENREDADTWLNQRDAKTDVDAKKDGSSPLLDRYTRPYLGLTIAPQETNRKVTLKGDLSSFNFVPPAR